MKWGTALVLARRHVIGHILHIALYRPDNAQYELSIDEDREPLPPSVVRHFRDIDKIKPLAEEAGLEIDIYKDTFQRSNEFRTRREFRDDYFSKLATKIQEYRCPIIAFLDPDTGIVPETFGYEHVTHREIQSLLRAMRSGDLLLFYQHARLGDVDWLIGQRHLGRC